jgi:hypothetical protein
MSDRAAIEKAALIAWIYWLIFHDVVYLTRWWEYTEWLTGEAYEQQMLSR